MTRIPPSRSPRGAGLALWALLALAAGCVTGPWQAGDPDPAAPPFPTLQTNGQAPLQQAARPIVAQYVLKPGDNLGIRFYNSAELNEDVVVRPDGKITVQLIGDVAAAGLTPSALAAALTTQYAGELAAPRITVIVRELGAQPIYVGGEVRQQGVLAMTTPLTLFQAIQQAGGFLPTAHRKQVIVIRREDDGARVGHAIDLREVQSGAQPGQDIPLEPYDIVFVPRSKIGEVNLFVEQYIRGVLPIQPQGFLPILF